MLSPLFKMTSMMKIDQYISFYYCQSTVFDKPIDFIRHISGNQQDFYRRIILKCVKVSYAQTVSKLKPQKSTKEIIYKICFS